MKKHNEFHADISDNGTRYRLIFITTEKNNFLAMQDLARKFIDGEEYLSLENRILMLEHDKRRREIREKVMGLFANMQHGKLNISPERTAYYESKLNEIFGAKTYVDTDSVRGESDGTDNS